MASESSRSKVPVAASSHRDESDQEQGGPRRAAGIDPRQHPGAEPVAGQPEDHPRGDEEIAVERGQHDQERERRHHAARARTEHRLGRVTGHERRGGDAIERQHVDERRVQQEVERGHRGDRRRGTPGAASDRGPSSPRRSSRRPGNRSSSRSPTGTPRPWPRRAQCPVGAPGRLAAPPCSASGDGGDDEHPGQRQDLGRRDHVLGHGPEPDPDQVHRREGDDQQRRRWRRQPRGSSPAGATGSRRTPRRSRRPRRSR